MTVCDFDCWDLSVILHRLHWQTNYSVWDAFDYNEMLCEAETKIIPTRKLVRPYMYEVLKRKKRKESVNENSTRRKIKLINRQIRGQRCVKTETVKWFLSMTESGHLWFASICNSSSNMRCLHIIWKKCLKTSMMKNCIMSYIFLTN